METWMIYGLIAAFLIACRDLFTKHFTNKYTTTEHLLYYYLLCGVFIGSFALYQHFMGNPEDKIRCIEVSDIWKYALFAFLSIAIISPCEVLSLKHCKNPGQSKSIINLSTLFVFVLAVIFLHGTFSVKQFIGIILTLFGVHLLL
jgi:uncharacterized membrane protein